MWKHHGAHIDKNSVVIIADKRKLRHYIALSTTTVKNLNTSGNRDLNRLTDSCVNLPLKLSINTSTAALSFTAALDFTARIVTIANCLPSLVNAADYAQVVTLSAPYYLLNT